MTFESNTNIGATLTRLSLGAVLLAHGLLKLFVFTLPGTVAFFAGLGLPAIAAYLTVFAEVVGGVAILAGLYTRLAALLSLPVLIGSLWAHIGNGWLFSGEGGGWEFPALLVALAVAVAIQGGGAFALRRLPVIDVFVPQVLKA
ncbi:DoxX family protein [Aliiroseovarius sediminis]|uniref:DoxX family protein n=1 Tax=Aliiroseovarius sediminis TaxID=2925839 RepID=UPI001F5635D3|nr:DoxX family protein [Aliiroseovarius sediminis]MCI2395017.1 DoxX family protein [Aliiroseovarius sediminis]